ncbi:MAG: ZIP family zinc transporter [Thermoleophilia bacterium]|nr:ZIP family zinc transporter [Thermoleophilia bacterium]
MLDAALWGLIAASSLVVGALIAFAVDVPDRILGLVLAFGSGVLMSTVAYELVEDALSEVPESALFAVAFGAGAVTFYVGSVLLVRGSAGPEADEAPTAPLAAGHAAPLPAGPGHLASHRERRSAGTEIVLGTILDGIPESVVLGLSLLGGSTVSVPLLVAVFISNVPEALGASADLRADGEPRGRVLRLWVIVALASAAAAGLGYAILGLAPSWVVTGVQAFAGGAILAMLAESMVPEAYHKGGRAVGLATAVGFAAAAILSAVS